MTRERERHQPRSLEPKKTLVERQNIKKKMEAQTLSGSVGLQRVDVIVKLVRDGGHHIRRLSTALS